MDKRKFPNKGGPPGGPKKPRGDFDEEPSGFEAELAMLDEVEAEMRDSEPMEIEGESLIQHTYSYRIWKC